MISTFLTLLAALFCGAAGTLFEVTWFRVLTPVLGNSAYSLAAVLAAFMAGFSLGGFLFGRLADRVRNPWLAFGAVSMVTAVSAWLISPATCRIAVSLTMGFEPGSPVLHAIRFTFSFLILLIPSLCIGGMLPLLIRLLSGSDPRGRHIGLLYGVFTIGSVAGIVYSGFYSIITYGLTATSTTGAAILVGVALLALLRSRVGFQAAPDQAARGLTGNPRNVRLALAVVTVSGFSLIACEILWYRILSFLLGNSVQSQNFMLTVLLTGMALGGFFHARFLSRSGNKLMWLGILHGSFAVAVLLMSHAAGALFVDRGVSVVRIFSDPMVNLTVCRFLHSLVVVLIPGFINGAAFPLAIQIVADERGLPGKSMGDASAMSALGSVCGAVTPLILMHAGIGYSLTLLLVIATNLAASAALLFAGRRKSRSRILGVVFPVVAVLLFLVLPSDILSRMVSRGKDYAERLFYVESPTASISVFKDRINKQKCLYVNDVGEVPTDAASIHCFKLLGHLPLLVHGDPKNVLMITFGGGIATGAAMSHDIERMDVVDIEPGVFKAAPTFKEENRDVLNDPRVHPWIEDGRNFLLNHPERFDVIISDSTHPRSADSWILYTLEFYTLCKARLRPGGVMTQWLPIHSLRLDTYASIVRTFREAFPYGSLWYTKDFTILLGTLEPMKIDLADLERAMSPPDVRADLAVAHLDDPIEILSTFVMADKGIEELTKDCRVNTDDLPHKHSPMVDLMTDPAVPAALVRFHEPIFPYLDGVGDRRDIVERLERGAEATDALIHGDVRTAANILPDSGRIQDYVKESAAYGDYVLEKVKYQPNNAQLRREVAGLYLKRGQFEQGMEQLEIAVELAPHSAVTWYTLGAAARRAGRNKLAEEAFIEATDLDPENWRAWKELGMLYLERRKPKLARRALEKVLELRPDDAKSGEALQTLSKHGF